MWRRVWFFLIVLFFILLSDAVLADWVPSYLQNALGSPSKMGLVMAISSSVGILFDLMFPQAFRKVGVRRLAGGALVGALLFLLTLLSHTWLNYAFILLIGMAVWGVYYELDALMTHQFVAGVASRDQRSSVWGVVGVVKSSAYFLGPLIGAWIIQWGDRALVAMSGLLLFIGYVLFLFIKLPGKPVGENVDWERINIWQEVQHWIVLGKRVWPVLLTSLMGGIVDATFWTTGAVLSDQLASESVQGGWLLPAYMLPFLFVGLIVAKWGIDVGKKRWAHSFLLLAGLFLCAFWWSPRIEWMLVIALMTGVALAAMWPLLESVYTDLISRSGHGKKHLMGMSSAMFGGAYILGPIMAGFLTEWVGGVATFGIVGFMVVVAGVGLLWSTPRKLSLPQTEIRNWD